MADITITIPDEYWPRVAAAFHGLYPDVALDDIEIGKYAFQAFVRNTWVAFEENENRTDSLPRYNAAAQEYSTSREQIDAEIREKNEQIADDAEIAFPGLLV